MPIHHNSTVSPAPAGPLPLVPRPAHRPPAHLSGHLPALQVRGATAFVRLNGREVTLGPAADPDTHHRYELVIAAWHRAGRQWLIGQQRPPATVAELGERYAAHARGYYTKRGRPTVTAYIAGRAFDLLSLAELADTAPAAFGPLHLSEFRAYLAGDQHQRWGLSTMREYTRAIVAGFRWAVSQQWVEESVWRALTSLAPLRRGRPVAPGCPIPRRPSPVKPVPQPAIDAAAARVPAAVAAMIQAQLHSAMRPGEVVAMRPADLLPTTMPQVWAYRVRPDHNKTDHSEIDRIVYLGPRAMAAIRPHLPADPHAFIFSPARSEETRNAARAADRQTPLYPSHLKARRLRFTTRPRPNLGDRYTVASYARAIRRACESAGVPPWSPNQLRHNAATVIANSEALHIAQVVLGHADIKTTLRYVTVRDQQAQLAALRQG